MAEPAPAKVNLALHVTGRRADGYHLLDSIVVFTEAGDSLSAIPVTQNTEAGLTITGPEAAGLDAGSDNLVSRAAGLMGRAQVGLRLEKRLPLSSGIGGGSADAAACLRLLSRVLQKPLPDDAAVLGLGADVPVCLKGAPSRMSGIGETLAPLPLLPKFWMVLANPRIEVSTPLVFAALARRDNAPLPQTLPTWRDLREFLQWLACQRNDLEAPARVLSPVISQVLRALSVQPGCGLARMSGSGATCFGLFETEAQARSAADSLSRAQPGWWVQATGLAPVPQSTPDQLTRATT